MSGFFAVSRDFWSDKDFRDEPMSRREAFLWLVAHAAFRDRTFDIHGKPVSLKRGQCAHSTRYLGRAFGWSEARVRRFLKHLKNRKIIDTPRDAASDAGVTVITLCNYNKYQGVQVRNDAPADAESDAKQNKEHKNNTLMSDFTDPAFGELWSIWPTPGRKRSSKKKAGGAFKRASRTRSSDDILRAARLYVRSADALKDGGQFVPGLHTWLGEERFEPWLESPALVAGAGASNSTITPWRY